MNRFLPRVISEETRKVRTTISDIWLNDPHRRNYPVCSNWQKDYLSFSGIKRETQLWLISTACPQLFTASPSLRRDSYYKTKACLLVVLSVQHFSFHSYDQSLLKWTLKESFIRATKKWKIQELKCYLNQLAKFSIACAFTKTLIDK